MSNDSDKPQMSEEELKKAIAALAIETGQGLWKTVSFEDIGGGQKNIDDGWCASESVVGSGHREIIYCGLEGLKNSHAELVEYKAFIDSGQAARFRLNASGRSAESNDAVFPIEEGEL